MLKTAQDSEKNMTNDKVDISFEFLLKQLILCSNQDSVFWSKL